MILLWSTRSVQHVKGASFSLFHQSGEKSREMLQIPQTTPKSFLCRGEKIKSLKFVLCFICLSLRFLKSNHNFQIVIEIKISLYQYIFNREVIK